MAQPLTYTTATIANGGSLSGAVELNGRTPHVLTLPAAWTAANVTFQVSVDGGTTFASLYVGDTEAEYKLLTTWTTDGATGVLRAIWMDSLKFRAITHLKVQSGTNGTPVNQGAQRIITIGLRDS